MVSTFELSYGAPRISSAATGTNLAPLLRFLAPAKTARAENSRREACELAGRQTVRRAIDPVPAVNLQKRSSLRLGGPCEVTEVRVSPVDLPRRGGAIRAC